MPSPKLKAVVVASKTIHGELSLRAIRDGKQAPIQLVLRECGFIPGDIVELVLIEEYNRLRELSDRYEDLRN